MYKDKEKQKEYFRNYYKKHKKYFKDYREAHPEIYGLEKYKEYQKKYLKDGRCYEWVKKWNERNKSKHVAHGIVGRKVRNGTLKRKVCEVCGNKKSDAHHEDYKKPLEVMWLCRQHHKDKHKELKNGKPN